LTEDAQPVASDRDDLSLPQGSTRRRFVASSAATALGIAAGFTAGHADSSQRTTRREPAASDDRVAFDGVHQAGIATPPPDHLHFATFDLTATTVPALRELLIEWSRAGRELSAGQPLSGPSTLTGPTETGEATGLGASALTLTIGFGPRLFDLRRGLRLEHLKPAQLEDLPSFAGESLEASSSGGDLCVQACAADAQVAFHAIHSLTRLAAPVATLRWTQTGFGRTAISRPSQVSPRNLLGFKDGTNNIDAADATLMNSQVWVGPNDAPRWMHGGTYMVVRRIEILLDVWDASDLAEQERSIGRQKLSGAPLGGRYEHDPVDLSAQSRGEPVIPPEAHIRQAAPASNAGQRILRRGYSYSDRVEPSSGELGAGLFFICFQRDPRTQFTAIQRRLSTQDALRRSIVHTASALFAIPPGSSPEGFVGETLFQNL
jgi:deferrochelatase/peroxidase EfeB